MRRSPKVEGTSVSVFRDEMQEVPRSTRGEEEEDVRKVRLESRGTRRRSSVRIMCVPETRDV